MIYESIITGEHPEHTPQAHTRTCSQTFTHTCTHASWLVCLGRVVSREEGEGAGGAPGTRKAVLTHSSRGRSQESAWVSEESRHRLPSVEKAQCAQTTN